MNEGTCYGRECKYKPIERPGLYIMVLIAMLNTCSISDSVNRLDWMCRSDTATDHELIEDNSND